MVTRRQISQAVQRGVAWLKSQQNEDGSYGRWNPGSTGLAVMALLGSGVPNTDPAVANAVSSLLDCEPPDSTYFRSLTSMALVANGDKSPDILRRVQTDVGWLIQTQGRSPGDTLSFGGWGHAGNPLLADGSNTHFALLALYSAARWGLEVPQETWNRALAWYRRNHDLNSDGSCFYDLKNKLRINKKEVLYSMTSAVLTSMKIIKMFSTDPDLKCEAQYLFDRAWSWLNSNYDVELSPDVSDSWRYLYLYSLKNGCAIEPYHAYMENRDWYTDIAGFLVSRQEPDGGWASNKEKNSTKIIYTSFSLMTLNSDFVIAATTDQVHTAENAKDTLEATHSKAEKALEFVNTKGDEECTLYEGGQQDTGGEEISSDKKGTSPGVLHPGWTDHPVEEKSEAENETKYLLIKQNPDGKWEIYVESHSIEYGHNDQVTTPSNSITTAPTNMSSNHGGKEDVEEENYIESTVKHDVIRITVNAGVENPQEPDSPEIKEEKGGEAENSPLHSLIEQFWGGNTGDKDSGTDNGMKKPWYTQMITSRQVYDHETSGTGRPDATIKNEEKKEVNSSESNHPAHPWDAFLYSLWGPKK